ncbi:MAG TPA: energy transducer TonB [Rhodocyclaceae bacterium]|nr:energy transducer TonB [Rhodocyclaceae bacterium]
MNDVREPHAPVARPGKRAAIVLAVVVHVLLAIFLIYGVRWQNSQPEAVEVDLVSSVPTQGEKLPTPTPPVTPPPKPAPEPPPSKPEPPKPKVEAPPPKPVSPPKPDIAIKDKKPEKKPEPVKPFDPIQDALKKEDSQNHRQQMASQMNSAASKELSQLQAAETTNKSDRDSYVGKIRDKIRGNIVMPPSVNGNPEVEFIVNQLPSGEVLDVKLKKSSGNTALDDAVDRAIRKSSPLPKPTNPGDFQRQLDLTWRPDPNGSN